MEDLITQPARPGHGRSCWPAATSSRCSAWPTGSWCCATAASAAELDPRRHPPGRPRRAAVRAAGGLLGPAPAHAAARSRRPPRLRRSVLQPLAHPVRARRGAGHRARLHPRRPAAPSLMCAASLGFAAHEIAPVATACCRQRRRSSRPRRGHPGARGGGGPARRRARGRSWANLSPGGVASSWSVPVMGPPGVSAVITVFRTRAGSRPSATSLTCSPCTPGYAASAVERDRSARSGDRAQPRAGDDPRDAGDAGRPGARRRRARDRARSRCAAACRPTRSRCVTAAGDGRAELAGLRRPARAPIRRPMSAGLRDGGAQRAVPTPAATARAPGDPRRPAPTGAGRAASTRPAGPAVAARRPGASCGDRRRRRR